MKTLRWLAAAAVSGILLQGAPSAPVIFEWERGIGLRIPGEPAADMYLWFYEWNMFEAMSAGQHTKGTYQLARKINAAGTEATIDSPALHLRVRARPDGAELEIRITNRTAHAWPEIAGIIPCWNPGQVPGTNPSSPLPLNRNFSDPSRSKSFFVGAAGLEPLATREIHFNARYRATIDRASENGVFVFSPKWPTSNADATAGLLVRESEDGRWVTGIGWDDFVSTQGHNPWSCLHACIRVGPLAPGESRTRKGRLFLFRGTKEECFARFASQFSIPR